MSSEAFKRNLRIIKRKKWPIILFAVVIVSLIASPVVRNAVLKQKRFSEKAPVALSDGFVKTTERQKINLIANRGFSCQAPENTIPAVEMAGLYGFDTVKIDVRPTEDGVWIVLNDDKLDTITDKKGYVSGKTYYDIVACNIIKGANHKDYDELKIPTLEHLLKSCLEQNIKPMIEIKDCNEENIDSLLEIIDKNGFTKSCSVASYDRNVLEMIQKRNALIKLYKLVEALNSKEMKAALDNPETGICFNAEKRINTEAKIKKLQNSGISIICRTVDDIETVQKYFKLGITDFVTNKIFDK